MRRRPELTDEQKKRQEENRPSAHMRRMLSAKWHLFMQGPNGETIELAGAEYEESISSTCSSMAGRLLTPEEKEAHEAVANGTRFWWEEHKKKPTGDKNVKTARCTSD